MVKKSVLAATLACSMLWSASAMAITPENQLTFDELMAGNARFAAGLTLDNLNLMSQGLQRSTTALAQTPKVIVLDCSDSRLSPEILFDKGLGELFVVRVAGNVIAPHQIASIEYAIEHLGAKMVVVLGHERCGGVTAAYNAFDAAGVPDATPAPAGPYLGLTTALKDLVTTMKPAVAVTKGHTYLYPLTGVPLAVAGTTINSVTATTTATDCILNNTHITMNDLKSQSEVIAGLLAKPNTDPLYDELLLVEAFYDLEDGVVTVTKATGNQAAGPITTIATTAETLIHTVTSSAGAGGTIKPSGDSAAVNGGSQKFRVQPAAGYVVDLVTGTCPAGTWRGVDYTVSGVLGNCTVAVSFKAAVAAATAPVAVGPTGPNAITTPAYSFTAATGATNYLAIVRDTTVNGVSIIGWIPAATACTGINCVINQVTPLTTGHNYSWVVFGYGATGMTPATAPMTFRIGP